MSYNHPLQTGLEKRFPELAPNLQVEDFADRIFVSFWDKARGEQIQLSTPHTTDASAHPVETWLEVFTKQIHRRLSK